MNTIACISAFAAGGLIGGWAVGLKTLLSHLRSISRHRSY